jgi:hypothetical protein
MQGLNADIQELDIVTLKHDLPEHSLKEGDRGAVVHSYQDGQAFEVEFVADTGSTIAIVTLAPADIQRSLPESTIMREQPKVQMTFNAAVYGAAGNIEGSQTINVADQGFETLLNDYKQFFNNLQQKYPAQMPEVALQPIIDAEFQEIQKTQPQRWQNFLMLKRLWKGGKKAVIKVDEHFTEENGWGKTAIAFLEGLTENME